MYNIVLVSGVQQRDSDKYINRYSFLGSFFIDYYKVFNTVPCVYHVFSNYRIIKSVCIYPYHIYVYIYICVNIHV